MHNIVLLTNATYFFITNTTVLQLNFTLQNRLGFPKCWCTCITTLSRMLRTATLYRISRYDNSLSVFILDFIREAYVVFTSLPFTNSYWPEYDTNIYLRDLWPNIRTHVFLMWNISYYKIMGGKLQQLLIGRKC